MPISRISGCKVNVFVWIGKEFAFFCFYFVETQVMAEFLL